MAMYLAKQSSRVLGRALRLRCSNGWFLAFSRNDSPYLQGGHNLPSLSCSNFFSNQISSTDEFNEDEDQEKLYSLTTLIVKGSDAAVLDSYTQFVTRAAKILNLDISRRTVLQTHFEKRTLLKSPHIYKKHRVQYELRTHGRMLKVNNMTCDTADTFLEYIQRNLPEGVSMNVEQTEVIDVPEYIRPPVQLIHETVEKRSQEQSKPIENQIN